MTLSSLSNRNREESFRAPSLLSPLGARFFFPERKNQSNKTLTNRESTPFEIAEQSRTEVKLLALKGGASR